LKQSWANKSLNEFLKYLYTWRKVVCLFCSNSSWNIPVWGCLQCVVVLPLPLILALQSKLLLLLIMMTHHRSIHHVVVESNITEINYGHYIADVNNHVQNQRVFLFLCYFNLVFTLESFYLLFNEHNNNCSNLLQSSCKPLDRLLYSKQASSKMLKFHLLSKIFITGPWKKTQINPTTYYTYGNKKKWTQTFP